MLDLFDEICVPTPLIQLNCQLFSDKAVNVCLKADYLTHPLLSGNKWRKLKYNLLEAKEKGFTNILSFGGAYSNHVYALAGVAKLTDFNITIAVRGDELNHNSNSTLQYAHECGVNLRFVSREEYRDKSEIALRLGDDFYLIPEGGTNELALRGCSEVIDEILTETSPGVIIAAMGTGGTVAGFATNKNFDGKIIGIPVIKGGLGLESTVKNLINSSVDNLTIIPDYHLGGYGKRPPILEKFIFDFENDFGILLDEIYTSKLCYAVIDLIRNDYFDTDNQVVIYHSGGLRR
ncbi:MAG: 1-aminocyclopropane-1-carboxylate deaminase [Spirosomataceae bacterium]|jgi:1-aminocyclopropane-1-carboxylate deaminase